MYNRIVLEFNVPQERTEEAAQLVDELGPRFGCMLAGHVDEHFMVSARNITAEQTVRMRDALPLPFVATHVPISVITHDAASFVALLGNIRNWKVSLQETILGGIFQATMVESQVLDAFSGLPGFHEQPQLDWISRIKDTGSQTPRISGITFVSSVSLYDFSPEAATLVLNTLPYGRVFLKVTEIDLVFAQATNTHTVGA